MLYIVAYDIGSEKERRKVSRALDGYGERAQQSVYLCELDQPLLAKLRRDLERLALTTGFVLAWGARGETPALEVGAESVGRAAWKPSRVFVF